MFKIVIYGLIAVGWLIVSIYRYKAKAKEEAERKRNRVPSTGPNAEAATSYDDLLRKIREAQQSEASAKSATTSVETTSRTTTSADSLEEIGPDSWTKAGKPIKSAHQGTLGRAGDGLGQERANPVLPPPILPSEKAHRQPTRPTTVLAPTSPTRYQDIYDQSAAKSAGASKMTLADNNTSLTKVNHADSPPTEASKLAKLLRDKQALSQAFLLQTILERKF